MQEDKFVGKWGIYPWFRESGLNLVHPDDLETFSAIHPYGKVFFCFKNEGEYVWLKYRDKNFRVKPILFKTVPPLKFDFDKEVTAVSSKNSQNKYEGKIHDIFWHTGKKEPFFLLKINGKLKSKRYFSEHLENIKNN